MTCSERIKEVSGLAPRCSFEVLCKSAEARWLEDNDVVRHAFHNQGASGSSFDVSSLGIGKDFKGVGLQQGVIKGPDDHQSSILDSNTWDQR